MSDKGGGKSYRKDRERKKSLGKKPSSGASEPEMSPPTKSQNQPARKEPERDAAEIAQMEKEAAEREEQEKQRMEKEKEEKEKLEQEAQRREQEEKEKQEREQLELYIQEAQARLSWKQGLRSANMEAAANRYNFCYIFLNSYRYRVLNSNFLCFAAHLFKILIIIFKIVGQMMTDICTS
jgi:hypothetical protein